MEYNELLENFKLLGDITRQPDGVRPEDVLLSTLNELIHEKIPEAFKKHAPPNYFELYDDFTALFDQLRNFVLHRGLIGKNVVALGGGFSSGKSSFLNALLFSGKNALPTSIDPSTAVPTFVVHGEQLECRGINAFDAHVPIRLNVIKLICEGFGKISDENGDELVKPVKLGHLLKSIFLTTPDQIYKNIAFADTPGFSKPDSDTAAANATDEHISRSQLNSSSYIIIFVTLDAGTLKKDDLDFIRSLRTDIPKLFIISKAEVKPSALNEVKAHIKNQLTLGGIPYVDVLAFSKNDPTGYDAEKIHAVLDRWNKSGNTPQFARSFKRLFIACRNYFEKEIDDERRRLERLNLSLTMLGGEDSDTIEPLRQMVKEIQTRVKRLKETLERTGALQLEFFTELKKLGDKVNIEMPEPTEAEMSGDTPDALEVLKEYKLLKGIKSNANTAGYIEDAFRNIVRKPEEVSGIANRWAMVELISKNILTRGDKGGLGIG